MKFIKMKYWIFVFMFLLLTSCNIISCNKKENENINKNHFDNVSKVEIYGDSLRIEYEMYENKVIQHHIDLKGMKDDGFDNSFTVTSTYTNKIPVHLHCKNKFKIQYDSLEFWFCTKKAIEYYDTLVTRLWNDENLKQIRAKLEKIKNKNCGELEVANNLIPFELAIKLDFQLIDLKANDTISDLLIENYETEFSGGKYYYTVSSNNDTICRLHFNEYMR